MIIIYLQRDPRGGSKSYTEYNYVEWDTERARVHAIGGIRRDWRCDMFPDLRKVFAPMLVKVLP